MGNQSSSPRKNQFSLQQILSKDNKHFRNAFINNSQPFFIKQILSDLNINYKNLESLDNRQTSSQFIHCLQFNDDLSFDKVYSRLSSRIGSSYKHLFNIKNIKIHEQKSLCSITRKLFIRQQSYDFNLKDLINKKSEQKKSFSQDQILILLNKIVQSVIWINDNEFRNVILDGEAIAFLSQCQKKEAQLQNYVCKIIDQDIVQSSSYKKLLQSLVERKSFKSSDELTQKVNLDFYLSPQLLQELQAQNFYPTVSLKSDIFTLGMLMMEICCQQQMYFCYNMEALTLDYESLIHRIAKISYSNELKLLLAEMLEYDENNRIGFVSLKEKIQKIMVKPFDQTRKLKRRSSSTMLKELLSCSRASYSVQNYSKPTIKNNSSSKISTVSLSAQKNQVKESPKTEKQTQQRSNISLTKNNSLTKSNSLINLKCKTNSFLTSKKSTLLQVNRNQKLETQSKNALQKQIKFETNKVDYSKILKNRIKNDPKSLGCPLGDQTLRSQTAQNMLIESNLHENLNLGNQQKINSIKTGQIQSQRKNQIQNRLKSFDVLMTDRSIHEDQMDRVSYRTINHSNFQQSNIQNQDFKRKNKQDNFKQQSIKFNHSFVQKKTINFENVKISSSQKMLKSKSLLANINQIKLHEQNQKKERFSTQGNCQENMINQEKNIKSENKINPKVSSFSLTKIHDNKSKKLDTQKNNIKVAEQIKNTNKNWIIGKLKAKNFIQSNNSKQKILEKQKNKSISKNKESSLTKFKCVSFAPQLSKNISIEVNQKLSQKKIEPITVNIDLAFSRKEMIQNNEKFSRGDTIIKRLQMTDQKSGLNFQAENNQNIGSNVKSQMQFVENVLKKCALSSSRWNQQASINQQLSEINYKNESLIKYSEQKGQFIAPQIKQHQRIKQGQFKKKSKVIDIDLGKLNNKIEQNRKQNSDQSKVTLVKQMTKNQKPKPSKLKRLKQLTIFTEDQQQKQKQNFRDEHKNYQRNMQNIDKQNNMKNSNLQDIVLDMKLNQMDQKIIRKSAEFQKNPNISSSLLGLNEIPYQRIEYVNKVSTIINPAITTPSSLNELNKHYGKGMTVQSSAQQSAMHKKNNSTFSKPFQEIQLYYQKEQQPQISSPNLNKDNQEFKPESRFKKSITIGSIKRQSDIFSMNNSEELTFRLKTNKIPLQQINLKPQTIFKKDAIKQNKQSNIQKLSYFEKQDGSFVMREQNPLKKIQTSSIIGGKSEKLNLEPNKFQEFFVSSNSKYNNRQIQSQYEGYKESFLDYDQDDRIMRQSDMNSSCSSINLSQIEYKAQRGESLLFHEQQKHQQKKQSNSKQKKYKHISILQPQQDAKNHSRNLSINIKNIKNQKVQKNIIVQSNNQSQQNTYRRYLKSDDCNSYTIDLNENFVYEGEINQDGQFEGNGMIYRKEQNKTKKTIIYTGSFVNDLYQGFGTLYQIQNAQIKKLRINNYRNRIIFGSKNNESSSDIPQTQIPIKYEGQFSQGMQNGFGTYFYSNGDKFSGCIKQGTVEGYGTYHIASTNEVLSGMWKNNVFMN